MKASHRFLAVVAGLGLLGGIFESASTDAAIINFEQPTYTVGGLGGQDGWASDRSTATVVSGGLDYSSGQVDHDGGARHLQFANTSLATFVSRALPGGSISSATAAQTLYFSYHYRRDTGLTADAQFTWFGISSSATINNTLGVTTSSSGFAARRRDGSANTTATAFSPIAKDDVYLVVGKLTLATSGGNSTVSVIVNPTTDTEPVTWSSTTSGNIGTTTLDTLFIQIGTNNPQHAFDEIRFGDSFASVVVVPEPASLSLLALGGLTLLRRRRA